jgi:hypothetical protein
LVEIAVAGFDAAGNFAWAAAGEVRPLSAPADGSVEIVEIEPK